MNKAHRRGLVVRTFLFLAAFGPAFPVVAQAVAEAPSKPDRIEKALTARDWSRKVWGAGRSGSNSDFYRLLEQAPSVEGDPRSAVVRDSASLLKTNLDKREADRAKRMAEVSAELDKDIADFATGGDIALSKALAHAVELQMLATDKPAVLQDPRIGADMANFPDGLIARADKAAKAAEARGDWLTCSELFYRLDVLLDEQATYKPDVERQNHRLSMLRLYIPQRLWELRNERQKAAKLDPLPPYNPIGDDFREKVAPISRAMVARAVASARNHVEQKPIAKVVLNGLESIKTMATTTDLDRAFPGLGNPAARDRFIGAVEAEARRIAQGASDFEATGIDGMLRRILDANKETVQIMDQAVLHEFGNGAMEELDQFSQIIWPDELPRFIRQTQGKLIGIGVEIQFDELSNIRVVTPLEGGPAQKNGIRAGDIIKRINGKPAFGITLDQAVDLITGQPATPVTITMERKDPEAPSDQAGKEIEFNLKRTEIELKSVKGWERVGTRDDDWNWMIDPVGGIGYVRLTGFTDTTTREFDRAIDQMKSAGLKGLVLDLRFNPGGLLDQAVNVVNRFLDRGVIVATRGPRSDSIRQDKAVKGAATLLGVPVVVLINEGSASASEIVSGAIQDHSRQDTIPGLIVGSRSYGKGSVQDVTVLTNDAAMKLTTQYYLLPKGRAIHRKPGERQWGVPPDLAVEMLPAQIADSLTLRQKADVMLLDEKGKPVVGKEPRPDPSDLLRKGLDVQLQSALVLLQSQSLVAGEQARKNEQAASGG